MIVIYYIYVATCLSFASYIIMGFVKTPRDVLVGLIVALLTGWIMLPANLYSAVNKIMKKR